MASHDPVIIDELFGKLELSENPEQSWAVVRTKPRCEKKLAEQARMKGIPYYLPQKKSRKIYKNRKVTFTIPLFSGYLFVCVDYFQKRELALTGFTAGLLKVANQQHLLDELKALRKIPSEKVEDAGPKFWLSKGLEVEIIKGPLAGTRAVVESHDKIHEARLQVDILRQAVIVRIDPKEVKIIGEFVIDYSE